MASTISPSDASSAQNSIGRTPARVPSTLRRSLLVKFTSVRYESPLNQGSWIQWWCPYHSQNVTVSEKQPCFRPLSYPKLQFWAKGTKVVGIPTCVAQHLPIWAWALSLNMRLKAIGATDLGSKGTYGIGGLSRKKYVKFSQKACSQPVFQAKRWDGLVLGNAPQREGNGV